MKAKILENAGQIIAAAIGVVIGGAIANLTPVAWAGCGVVIGICAFTYRHRPAKAEFKENADTPFDDEYNVDY